MDPFVMRSPRFRLCLCAAALFAGSVSGSGSAMAQAARPPAPASAPAADPRIAAAQAAFEALPEAERKAIQFDLVWAGSFTGANSGGFGPLTYRAINAFKSKSGAVTDGILSAADRKALAAAAKAARDNVAFQTLPDARTGARIGIPQSILPRKDVTPSGGSRWQSADGLITLDTRSGQKGDTLQALFDKATTSTTPGRKVTYKLIRPDFYVVSGETASGKFYSRMASGPDGLRGFSVGYDKALAENFDPLVIAIANSFDPFPGATIAAAATAPPVAGNPAANAPALPVPVAMPQRPKERHGAGLIVANGLVLTAKAAIAECKMLKIGAREARLRLSDDAGGLALLDVEGLAMTSPPRLAQADPASGETVAVMAFSDAPVPSAIALPGSIAAVNALAITAPLQPGGAGAVAYDQRGAILGVASANPSERYLVAGVVPQRSHAFAGKTAIAALLQKAGITLTSASSDKTLTTGAIAQSAMPQIVPLTCTQ